MPGSQVFIVYWGIEETICWLARDILVDDTFVDNDVPYIRAENLLLGD
jgi:hypothetical protein